MRKTWPGLLVPLVAAATFVLVTGRRLPPIVASHFGGAGHADGFMTRDAYLTFMAALVFLLPLLLALSGSLVRRLPVQLVNVPHREYWLAPERREATLTDLGARLAHFAWLLAAFLCFVHWRVVVANGLRPPYLSPAWFVPALVLFFVVVAVWLVRLFRRFPRP